VIGCFRTIESIFLDLFFKYFLNAFEHPIPYFEGIFIAVASILSASLLFVIIAPINIFASAFLNSSMNSRKDNRHDDKEGFLKDILGQSKIGFLARNFLYIFISSLFVVPLAFTGVFIAQYFFFISGVGDLPSHLRNMILASIFTASYVVVLASIFVFVIFARSFARIFEPEGYLLSQLVSLMMDSQGKPKKSLLITVDALSFKKIGTSSGRKRLASTIDDLVPTLRKCVSVTSRDPVESIRYQHIQDHIIKDFQSLKRWIYTPKADTDEYLQKRLLEYVRVIATGDIDSLLVNYSEPDEPLKPKATVTFYAKRYSNLIIRAAIPFIIILLVDRFFPGFNEQIHGYAIAGAIMFAAVVALGELDPNIEERIKFAQESILAFLSRGK
jgi:hypothetical protein